MKSPIFPKILLPPHCENLVYAIYALTFGYPDWLSSNVNTLDFGTQMGFNPERLMLKWREGEIITKQRTMVTKQRT